MVAIQSLFITLIASTAFAYPGADSKGNSSAIACLSDNDTQDISIRWLRIWESGALSSPSDLESIVTKDVEHLDGAFGPSTTGVEALYESATYPDPYVKDIKMSIVTSFHDCGDIALRWKYTATTTGYNGTTKAGTTVSFYGTDLLSVDLNSHLIYNATASGDWLSLATQLGETCNV